MNKDGGVRAFFLSRLHNDLPALSLWIHLSRVGKWTFLEKYYCLESKDGIRQIPIQTSSKMGIVEQIKPRSPPQDFHSKKWAGGRNLIDCQDHSSCWEFVVLCEWCHQGSPSSESLESLGNRGNDWNNRTFFSQSNYSFRNIIVKRKIKFHGLSDFYHHDNVDRILLSHSPFNPVNVYK